METHGADGANATAAHPLVNEINKKIPNTKTTVTVSVIIEYTISSARGINVSRIQVASI